MRASAGAGLRLRRVERLPGFERDGEYVDVVPLLDDGQPRVTVTASDRVEAVVLPMAGMLAYSIAFLGLDSHRRDRPQ